MISRLLSALILLCFPLGAFATMSETDLVRRLLVERYCADTGFRPTMEQIESVAFEIVPVENEEANKDTRVSFFLRNRRMLEPKFIVADVAPFEEAHHPASFGSYKKRIGEPIRYSYNRKTGQIKLVSSPCYASFPETPEHLHQRLREKFEKDMRISLGALALLNPIQIVNLHVDRDALLPENSLEPHFYEVSENLPTPANDNDPSAIRKVRHYWIEDTLSRTIHAFNDRPQLKRVQYAVAAKLPLGKSVYSIRDGKDFVIAPLEKLSHKQRAYWGLMAIDSKATPPTYVRGTKKDSNDGTNAPWWNWSFENIELADVTEVSDRSVEWKIVGLLDENGSIVAGTSFRDTLQTLDASLVQSHEWSENLTPMQRSFSMLFKNDENKITQLDAKLQSLAGADPEKKISAKIQLSANKTLEPTFAQVRQSAEGFRTSDPTTPLRRHSVVLMTDEYLFFEISFRSDIFSKTTARVLSFDSAAGEVTRGNEPVRVKISMTRDGLGLKAGAPLAGKGLLRVNSMAINREGRLSALNADLYFQATQAQVFKNDQGTGEIIRPEGVVKLNLSDARETDPCKIVLSL